MVHLVSTLNPNQTRLKFYNNLIGKLKYDINPGDKIVVVTDIPISNEFFSGVPGGYSGYSYGGDVTPDIHTSDVTTFIKIQPPFRLVINDEIVEVVHVIDFYIDYSKKTIEMKLLVERDVEGKYERFVGTKHLQTSSTIVRNVLTQESFLTSLEDTLFALYTSRYKVFLSNFTVVDLLFDNFQYNHQYPLYKVGTDFYYRIDLTSENKQLMTIDTIPVWNGQLVVVETNPGEYRLYSVSIQVTGNTIEYYFSDVTYPSEYTQYYVRYGGYWTGFSSKGNFVVSKSGQIKSISQIQDELLPSKFGYIPNYSNLPNMEYYFRNTYDSYEINLQKIWYFENVKHLLNLSLKTTNRSLTPFVSETIKNVFGDTQTYLHISDELFYVYNKQAVIDVERFIYQGNFENYGDFTVRDQSRIYFRVDVNNRTVTITNTNTTTIETVNLNVPNLVFINTSSRNVTVTNVDTLSVNTNTSTFTYNNTHSINYNTNTVVQLTQNQVTVSNVTNVNVVTTNVTVNLSNLTIRNQSTNLVTLNSTTLSVTPETLVNNNLMVTSNNSTQFAVLQKSGTNVFVVNTQAVNSTTTNTVSIWGTLGVSNNLVVQGNTQISGTTTIQGSTTINNSLTVSNNTTINGSTTINNTLGVYVTNNRQFVVGQNTNVDTFVINTNATNSSTTNTVTINGSTRITQNLHVENSLNVSVNTTLNTTTINGSTNINNNVTITSQSNSQFLIRQSTTNNVVLVNTNAVNSNSVNTVTIWGSVGVTNNLTVGQDTNIVGNLSVSGTTNVNTVNISGQVVLNNTFRVITNNNRQFVVSQSNTVDTVIVNTSQTNSSSIQTVEINGSVNITRTTTTENLSVSNSATINNSTTINGTTTINNTLTLTANHQNQVLVRRDTNTTTVVINTQQTNSTTNTVTVNGSVGITKNLTVQENLNVLQNTTINGNTQIVGNLTVNGQTTIYNTQTIYVTNNRQFVIGQSQNTETVIVNTVATNGENTVFVNGSVTVTRNLTVNNVTLNNDLSVNGKTSLINTVTINGQTEINNTLTVTTNNAKQFVVRKSLSEEVLTINTQQYDSSLQNTITIRGTLSLSKNLLVGENTSIQGTTTINGVTTINNSLFVNMPSNEQFVVSNSVNRQLVVNTQQINSTTSNTLTVHGSTYITHSLTVSKLQIRYNETMDEIEFILLD